MKRGAPEHPKTFDLAETLGLELWGAVGILESLWSWTGKYAAAGDIGKYSKAAIARGIGWKGDIETLFSALFTCRLLDTDERCKFKIHDWYDHCDDATHMKLARARTFFVNGEKPKLSRLPQDERESAQEFYSRAHAVSVPCARRERTLPPPPLPSQALPDPQNGQASIFGGIGIMLTVSRLIEMRGWTGQEKLALIGRIEKKFGNGFEYIHAARLLANAKYARTRQSPAAWLEKVVQRDTSPDAKINAALREIRAAENGNGKY